MHIRGYWEVTLAYWRGNQYRNRPDQTQHIADIGLTPVVRFERDDRSGLYAEAGVGPHLLSAHYDNNGRKLSTNFQFGSHVGLGYVLPNKLDIGVKLQHVSNGGIKQPNNGVNLVGLRLGYPF
jgi:lipid A 3-O-deacylase